MKIITPVALPDDAPATALGQLDAAEFNKAIGLDFSDEKTAEEQPAAPATEPVAATPVTEQPAPAEVVGEAAAPSEETKPEPELEADAGATSVEAKPPLTSFIVHDKEGELELPELYLSFNADKKEYKKLPLEKVVAFAQMGIYNERRQRETVQTQHENAQLKDRAEAAEGRMEEVDVAIERLFSDPTYFERAKELYLAQNSPENRATRAEQQLTQVRQQQAAAREDQQIGTFVVQQLTPAFESLKQQAPLVSEAELIGQYTILTAPLLVRGRIPLSRLADVQTLVENDLSSWARTLQTERGATKRREDTTRKAATAQVVAAKRTLARAAAPRGNAAPPAPAKPPKFETSDDWFKTLGGLAPADAED